MYIIVRGVVGADGVIVDVKHSLVTKVCAAALCQLLHPTASVPHVLEMGEMSTNQIFSWNALDVAFTASTPETNRYLEKLENCDSLLSSKAHKGDLPLSRC